MSEHPRLELGAYALGALAEEDEAPVREHLARCSACRDEHARLAGLRPLLDLAEPAPEPPAQAEPSPLVEDAVLAGFRGTRSPGGTGPRRRTRLRLPALRVALPSAALGAALAVAVLALAGAFSGDDGAPRSTTVELRGDAGSARAVLAAAEVGTTIELDARLPPSGRREHYDVFMVSGDYRISAGTFRVGADGRVTVELACGGPPDVYDAIVVERDGRRVLSAALPA